MQSVRPCASSLGKGHHELHAADEVHVQQHGNDSGQHWSTFRPGSQASQGHVICQPSTQTGSNVAGSVGLLSGLDAPQISSNTFSELSYNVFSLIEKKVQGPEITF